MNLTFEFFRFQYLQRWPNRSRSTPLDCQKWKGTGCSLNIVFPLKINFSEMEFKLLWDIIRKRLANYSCIFPQNATKTVKIPGKILGKIFFRLEFHLWTLPDVRVVTVLPSSGPTNKHWHREKCRTHRIYYEIFAKAQYLINTLYKGGNL